MASTGSSSGIPGPEAATAHADLVIGLTSDNDVRTVGAAARAIRDGAARAFPDRAVRFVLADAGSTDGTREAALEVIGAEAMVAVVVERGSPLAELPYHGHPARPAALRAILQASERLGAGACAVVDARLETVQPEWIERLIGPVLVEGFDYVSPYYARPLGDGAMTRALVYPMFRALYGARLRQPAAGEFGCSGRLVTYLLEQDVWEVEHAPAAIDLWLAVAAVCGEFRSCEATLGRRGPARASGADLSTTLAQVAGALFVDLDHRVDIWQRIRGSAAIPVFGGGGPPDPDVSVPAVEALIDSYRLGYRELRDIWTWVLPPRTIVELRKLTEVSVERFRVDDRLWAGIIYDFAIGYSSRAMPRDHLLRSLTPLYSGWLASFVLQLGGADQPQIEDRVEQLCRAFEVEKRHLIARWRWPERLRK